LFTDIVMPGLDGTEVARRALARSPRLKVLLASGYTTGPTLGCRLLKKPYRPQQLVGEVAAALGK
jgi:CheY-like chemotaxis protein